MWKIQNIPQLCQKNPSHDTSIFYSDSHHYFGNYVAASARFLTGAQFVSSSIVNKQLTRARPLGQGCQQRVIRKSFTLLLNSMSGIPTIITIYIHFKKYNQFWRKDWYLYLRKVQYVQKYPSSNTFFIDFLVH